MTKQISSCLKIGEGLGSTGEGGLPRGPKSFGDVIHVSDLDCGDASMVYTCQLLVLYFHYVRFVIPHKCC